MNVKYDSRLGESLEPFLKAVGVRGNLEAVKQAIKALGFDTYELFPDFDDCLDKAKDDERKALRDLFDAMVNLDE